MPVSAVKAPSASAAGRIKGPSTPARRPLSRLYADGRDGAANLYGHPEHLRALIGEPAMLDFIYLAAGCAIFVVFGLYALVLKRV